MRVSARLKLHVRDETALTVLRARAFLRLVILMLLFAVCGTAMLAAHPHMFLDSSVTVRTEVSGVSGVVIEWVFDEWFSASILLDYDLDRNRRFDRDETDEVYAHAFSNLRNFDFFTYFALHGETIPASQAIEFAVGVRDDRITYSFFVPFRVPFESGTADFSIAVYDRTFFCDVAYAKEHTVSLENPSGFKMDYEIRKDETISIRYDNSIIGAARTDSSYTGVFHPERIHIVVRK